MAYELQKSLGFKINQAANKINNKFTQLLLITKFFVYFKLTHLSILHCSTQPWLFLYINYYPFKHFHISQIFPSSLFASTAG